MDATSISEMNKYKYSLNGFLDRLKKALASEEDQKHLNDRELMFMTDMVRLREENPRAVITNKQMWWVQQIGKKLYALDSEQVKA